VSDTSPPAYTITASLGWFTAVFVIASVALAVGLGFLQTIGISLPSTGLGVGIYAGAVAAAGLRFSSKREWTRRDRNLLALGYTLIAATLSCVFSAAVFFIDPTVSEMFGSFRGILAAAIVIALMLLIYFAMAWLILMLIARRRNSEYGQ